jgi:catechol-2,3-dioxygenase
LRDPDDNGVELSWDRLKGLWPGAPDGSLAMYTRRVDLKGLPKEPEALNAGSGPRDTVTLSRSASVANDHLTKTGWGRVS